MHVIGLRRQNARARPGRHEQQGAHREAGTGEDVHLIKRSDRGAQKGIGRREGVRVVQDGSENGREV